MQSEDLPAVQMNFTSPQRLVLHGRGAGGLAVAAAVNLNPGLFQVQSCMSTTCFIHTLFALLAWCMTTFSFAERSLALLDILLHLDMMPCFSAVLMKALNLI